MPQVKHAGRYRFLNHFGLTGEYMKLELKMIFRNKAPKKELPDDDRDHRIVCTESAGVQTCR